MFALLAALSMIAGNLLALLQNNLKRILAYSSIAHVGYVTVAFLALGEAAVPAAGFYFVAYFAATLAAFGVVSVLSGGVRDADSIDDYRGLAWRRPYLAGVLTAALLSLAGIPLTAGFVGKFYVLFAGVSSDLWVLALVLVVTSVIGLFYYLRVVVAVFRTSEEASAPAVAGATASCPPTAGVALAAVTAAADLVRRLPRPPHPPVAGAGEVAAQRAGEKALFVVRESTRHSGHDGRRRRWPRRNEQLTLLCHVRLCLFLPPRGLGAAVRESHPPPPPQTTNNAFRLPYSSRGIRQRKATARPRSAAKKCSSSGGTKTTSPARKAFSRPLPSTVPSPSST